MMSTLFCMQSWQILRPFGSFSMGPAFAELLPQTEQYCSSFSSPSGVTGVISSSIRRSFL